MKSLVLPKVHLSYLREAPTLCHFDCFIELAVPLLRLFLILSMMPLKRCVAKEIDFTALLKNEALKTFLMTIEAGP